MPETKRHLDQRTALYVTVRSAFGDRAHVGSEQFVYWSRLDPSQCCAPDVLVKLGGPDAPFDSWKTWERGAPDLAVEIVSRSDQSDRPWEAKLASYDQLGVAELVRFDPDDADRPLRIWNEVEGDLVERDPDDADFARCDTLDLYWVVRAEPGGLELRLAHDREGRQLLATPEEARLEAEARVRELEAELARLRGAGS